MTRNERRLSSRQPSRRQTDPFMDTFFFAINRSSSGQNKESELLIAATVLQAASWLLRSISGHACISVYHVSVSYSMFVID